MAARRIQAADLWAFACEALQRVGCSADDAESAANVLRWASLRGVDTHGFRNLAPYYVEAIRTGTVNPVARFVIEHETASSARMDGASGLGLVNATEGMRIAIDKAHAGGVGLVAIHNTHHLGPAGFYSYLAVEEDMLGFCATGHFFGEGNEVGVAPINGSIPMFSTNPLSFAAPCDREPPFILDMSTAVATVNRIEGEGQLGTVLPAGWAKDATSQPTMDPLQAKILYPLGGTSQTGGHKGAGLAMMVSILTGVLTGGWSAIINTADFEQATMGHFLAAVRIDQFMPRDQFVTAMDAYVNSIRASPRIEPAQEVHYPGSQEYAVAETRLRDGIPIDERLRQELRNMAESLTMDTSLLD